MEETIGNKKRTEKQHLVYIPSKPKPVSVINRVND